MFQAEEGKILNAKRVEITPEQLHELNNEERKGETFAIAKAAELTGSEAGSVLEYAVQETEQGIFLRVKFPDFESEAAKAAWEKAEEEKAAKASQSAKEAKISYLKMLIEKAQSELAALEPQVEEPKKKRGRKEETEQPITDN